MDFLLITLQILQCALINMQTFDGYSNIYTFNKEVKVIRSDIDKRSLNYLYTITLLRYETIELICYGKGGAVYFYIYDWFQAIINSMTTFSAALTPSYR